MLLEGDKGDEEENDEGIAEEGLLLLLIEVPLKCFWEEVN